MCRGRRVQPMPVSTCPHQGYAAALPRHPAHAANARAVPALELLAFRLPAAATENTRCRQQCCAVWTQRGQGGSTPRQLPAQGKLCAPCCLEVWVKKQIPFSLLTAHRTQHNIIFQGLLLLSCLTLPSCGWTTSRSALGSPCASTGTSRVGQVVQVQQHALAWKACSTQPAQR